jgi:membrane fusion protein (multidrug efflux system)
MTRPFYPSFLLLLALLSCEAETATQQELPMDSFRAEVEATRVKTSRSERRSFDYLVNASGKVEARDQVKAVVERSGYLIDLAVKEGDRVEAGQVLARLDPSESRFQLEKAQARLRDAQVAYDSDILSFQGIMDGDDSLRRTAVAQQVRSSSGLLMAEIELREAEMAVEKSVLKAPISGQVADLVLKEGSLVNAGDILCEILSTGALELKVKVLESDIGFISPGQQAEIHPVSGNTGTVAGTVASINPKVDEHGLVQVTLRLSGSGGLLPGMNARAVIHAPQSNTIVVPKQAVVYRSERPVVFTIQDNLSQWNYVEVGRDNGREIEILDGLAENNTVIVTNNLQLAHQAPVQISEE